MAPLNGKKPALNGSRSAHDEFDASTSDEEHAGLNRTELECPFQVETFRQAATDSSSASDVYIVRPVAIWESLSRFKKFSVYNEHYALNDDVYITRYFTNFNRTRDGTVSSRVERDEEWAARVVEITGFDQAHVYLRVMWYYNPEDLPRGREEYHGSEELIRSNDTAIVLGSSVIGHADIPKWNEAEEDEPPKHASPYWRQTYDKVTGQLSELPTYCTCFDPQNPDAPLIRCTNPDCAVRMHQHCIHEEFEADLYARNYREERDAARFPPDTMFNVKIINVDDPHNYRDDIDPPLLEITDNRSTPPDVWEHDIVCLRCEEPLAYSPP